MKKTILLCLAVILLSANAGAQVFNRLSVGAGVGTDGLSIELATPIGSHVDLRAGYGAAVGLLGYQIDKISLPEHPGNPDSQNVNVPLKLNLGVNDARLLFNIYPSAHNGFHFTVGAFMGSSCVLRGTFTGVPSDYYTVGFDVDGYLVKADQGKLVADICAPGLGSGTFAVKPYFGIGFGRAVSPEGRVSFSIDLGVQYQGKIGLWADGESLTGRVKKVQIDSAIEELSDTVEDIAKYTNFWPTLNFRLYVKLF